MVAIKYIGPFLIYKSIDADRYLLMTLDVKILRGLFGHERLKPAIMRRSPRNVSKLAQLKHVMNIGIRVDT